MIWTVHRKDDEVRFVPETKSIWAFLFGSLWLAWHGLWVWAAAWLVFTLGLQALVVRFTETDLRVSLLASFIVLLPRLWLLLEGHDLRRRMLERRSFTHDGVVEAQCERDAFLRYCTRGSSGSTSTEAERSRGERSAPRPSPTFGLVPMQSRTRP